MTMDYKERLRLAKEALESGSYDKDTIEYIFPELKESEDERIREKICKLLWDNAPYEEAQEYIAWLEKQGEQKPAWSEEDEQYLLVCKNALVKYQITDKGDAYIIYHWLKNKLKSIL